VLDLVIKKSENIMVISTQVKKTRRRTVVMSAILNEMPKRKRLLAYLGLINPSKRQNVADDGISTGTPIVSGIRFVV
jgi:hypothetical protein